ncbi:MAG: SGNH/GDSL hydrolase family protein [Beijerinckiaceae bacterium]|nr:SGNH/GDSL hydrolase family protein [Beijerinckiaceae bacterium]
MVEQRAFSDRSERGLKKVGVLACAAVAMQLTGFSAPGGDAAKPASPAKPAAVVAGPSRITLRIIAFGSSSTQGVGASSPSASYPAQLQADLMRMVPKGETVEVVNRGIGGQDADDMMLRLQSDVIVPKPNVVIWQTGSNDPLRGVPLGRFESDTREGIKALRRAGVAVILMEPQWCPRLDQAAHADDYRQAVRKIGQDLDVPVIRRSDMMHQWISEGRMTRAQMLAPDGLHMSDSGYAELARDIAPLVLKAAMIAPTATAVSRSK